MNEISNIEQLHDNFHEGVRTNFLILLDSFDYEEEMQLLNISLFNFQQRKNMIREFQGLYVALWSMALSYSLPQDRDIILQQFIEIELPKKYDKKQLPMQIKRIHQYIELIGDDSAVEFSPISHHILSLLNTKEDEFRSMSLKIALHIRSVYTYLFERLF